MTKDQAIRIAGNVRTQMRGPYYQGVAAELSFFFLLSMVPLSFLLAELLGVFSISSNLITEFVYEYVSADIASAITGYVYHDSSGTLNLVLLAISIWSASQAQYSMIRITNYTFTGAPNGKGFVKERIRAMGSVVITVVLLVFSLVILVYGEQLMRVVGLYAELVLLFPFQFSQIWYIARWPIGIAFFFFTISLIFYLLPTVRIPYKKLIPGSLFTSAGMMVVTFIYSIAAARFLDYNVLYGSLGTVVGLMVWFYLLGSVFVIGIIINASLYHLEEPSRK